MSAEDGSTSSSDPSSVEENVLLSTSPGLHQTSGPDKEDPDVGDGLADPDSPNSKSDTTNSSSEGVLVEHPVNAYQEPRTLPHGHRGARDPDESGIFVNIDGSMQENVDGDDGSKEDAFVDAPDDLGFVEGRTSDGLEESIALIEIGENTVDKQLVVEVNRLRSLLSNSLDECRRYKGEHESLGKEIDSIQYQLKVMIVQRSPNNEGIVENIQLPNMSGDFGTNQKSIHSKLHQCSGLASHLGAVLCSKDQAIDDLNGKLLENLVSHDVVSSYMSSLRNEQLEYLQGSYDAFVKRLSVSLAPVIQDNVIIQDSANDEASIVENKMHLLIDRYSWFYYYIEQLRDCLSRVGSKFAVPQGEEVGVIFQATQNELLESKTNETYYIEKINDFKQDKVKMNEQLDKMKENLEEAKSKGSKAKAELEHMEQRFIVTKEKLGLAVTKGKALVQNRDSLKHVLAEKSFEIEKCLQELKQKSDALEASEQSAKELGQSHDLALSLQNIILEKDNILKTLKETLSQSDIPEELQSIDTVDRIKWLIDQRKLLKEATLENNKLLDTLSSFGLPSVVTSMPLEHQINWLFESFSHTKEDATKLKDEIVHVQTAFESCELQLSEAFKEIEQLKHYISIEKQEKDSLEVMNEDLMMKYETTVETLTKRSAEKNRLMRGLGDASECLMNDETSVEVDAFIDLCIGKIRERIDLLSKPSSSVIEGFQTMQSLLYIRNLELAFCENMLEEEMVARKELGVLSANLSSVSEEAATLRNERDMAQNDLQRAEEKSLLIREKLTMAVKKGKGLVQEREGFKKSLDEKSSEIDKLKHELKLQETMVIECKDQIRILTDDLKCVEKLELDIASVKCERDKNEQMFLESNDSLKHFIKSVEKISLPSVITFEGPLERIDCLVKHFHEIEMGKINAEQQLEKLKKEAVLQSTELSDSYTTLRFLEDSVSKLEERLSIIFQEKEQVELAKSSVELELLKVKEETDMQAGELRKTYDTLNSLEEALSKERNSTSLLTEERNELESKSKHEIMTLNTKIASCMEDLAGTSGNLEDQLANLLSQFKQLLSLTKDDSFPSRFSETFQKNVESVKNMAHLVESIHIQFSSDDIQAHSRLKQDSPVVKLLSLPKFEDYININEKTYQSDGKIAELADDIPSFTKVSEGIASQSKIVDDYLVGFSSYMQNHFTLLVQALQEIRDDIIHGVEFRESYKKNINELEALNQTQVVEISTLQKDLRIINGACSEAIQILQINFDDLLDEDHSKEILMTNLDMGSSEASVRDIDSKEPKDHIQTVEKLLLVVKRIKSQIDRLLECKCKWVGSLDDLEKKLEETELTAKSAIQDKDLQYERVTDLEDELNSLQILFSELKSTVEDYQEREVMWKGKEKELFSSQQELKSAIQDKDLQCKRVPILDDKLNSLQCLCDDLGSKVLDYQAKEITWKDKEIELISSQEELKSVIQDKDLQNEKVATLEDELNSMQSLCSELNSKVEDYQTREILWKDKERELDYFQNELALKNKEDKMLVLDGRLGTIFDRVNKMDISSELKLVGGEQSFSNPMDKVLYILNKFETLQKLMVGIINEKENLQSTLAVHVDEVEKLKKTTESLIASNQELENMKNHVYELNSKLESLIQNFCGKDLFFDDKRPLDATGLLSVLERLLITSGQESESSKSRAKDLGAKLQSTQKVVDELIAKVKSLESIPAKSILRPLPDTKERSIFEPSSSVSGSEISEIEDLGAVGIGSQSHVRQMRKGSPEQIVLNIDTESERLISPNESDDKGHVFKSLNASGLIPNQGKLIADRIDSIWVSGGRLLMGRPGTRMGLIAYWFFLHIWMLGSIL